MCRMEQPSDPLGAEEWVSVTSEAIRRMEKRCQENTEGGREKEPGNKDRPKSDPGPEEEEEEKQNRRREASEKLSMQPEVTAKVTKAVSFSKTVFSRRSRDAARKSEPSLHFPALELPLEDLKYIDESSRSTLSIGTAIEGEREAVSPSPSGRSCSSLPAEHPSSRMGLLLRPSDRCTSPLNRRPTKRRLHSSGSENDDEEEDQSSVCDGEADDGEEEEGKEEEDGAVTGSTCSPAGAEATAANASRANCYSQAELDRQSVYSLYLEKDFRYYFQHPYARLFVSYFVIFCNFLIFAEDPVSHSHAESEIPVVGNVFSFIATKYPPEWTWTFLKVALWLIAMLIGLIIGKYLIHHVLLRQLFRLKMFRDEQGTWVIMLLTVIMSCYLFSLVYNFLLSSHPRAHLYTINTQMGITNANFMKAAACGTWLGDFVTAWMVTDLMLQDNLYSEWARPLRRFWRAHGRVRIFIFWTGSVFMTSMVVTLIVSDHISWDRLNRDFVATTELSRAFLASFILVMDLLIVMQDWDFPHFVCDLDIKLPGMHVASFKFNLFQKYVSVPDVDFHITGKWFNYGIIVIVMILDLNMWKNQIFYSPEDYGQYTGPDNKIHTVDEWHILETGNTSLWTYAYRSTHTDPETNDTYWASDMQMNSRYLAYPMSAKGMAFIPSLLGFVMFGLLTYLYGRFPPKTDATAGGRFRKRKREVHRSSWRRERGSSYKQELGAADGPKRRWALRGGRRLTDIVVAWNEVYGTSCGKPSVGKPL